MPRRAKGRSKGDRRAEMTPEDCYLDVKDFWLRSSPEQRSGLLRVPIRQLILGELRCLSLPVSPTAKPCGAKVAPVIRENHPGAIPEQMGSPESLSSNSHTTPLMRVQAHNGTIGRCHWFSLTVPSWHGRVWGCCLALTLARAAEQLSGQLTPPVQLTQQGLPDPPVCRLLAWCV